MNSNYEVLIQRPVADLKSEGYLLKHKKSGAMVTALLNDDENKVFYVGFRTPPVDSTGVPHILEHSTLCGSAKYPVKDPFIELAKGSLNTFLNAMTFPDKTVYPVASCNDKDFRNLVDVYLDAVFHPNVYKTDKIFKQEGWHYELEDADSELTLNGVVYSEMKGVFSSPDDVVEEDAMRSLYPDTTYGNCSGGDPDCIPSLTYENFLGFHDRFYHPANSYIYLYGNIDLDDYLDYLDREYLSQYDVISVDSEIVLQKPFEAPLNIEKEYAVLSEEDEDGAYLTYNISMGTSLDKKFYVALEILDYVLCSAPGSLIHKALIDAGIGEDVYSIGEAGIYQPYFSVISKNASINQKELFVSIIEEELKKAVKEGLPKKSLLAAINVFEFKYREADYGSYPKGLIIGLQALDSWLYDKTNPFMHIEQNDTYQWLRENVDSGYFEELIQKYFIDNTHKTIVSFTPKAGLTQIKDEKLKCELAKYKSTLSKEELEQLVADTKALKKYQSEPSNTEDLAKLPMLSREDLKKEAVFAPNELVEKDGFKVLWHNVYTNQISYLGLMFRINDVPKEMLPYVGLLKSVIGLMNTENYEYQDLFDEIHINSGGFGASSNTYLGIESDNELRSYFSMKIKMLYGKTDVVLELLKEMMTRTIFDDEKRLKELVLENKSRIEAGMISSGHSVAMTRALSYISKATMFDEEISGRAFYRFIKDIADNFDTRKTEVITNLKKITTMIFRSENLLVDYIGDEKGLEALTEHFDIIKSSLFTEKCEKAPYIPELSKENEGFLTAGKVQYVCIAGNYKNKGLEYTGALKVLHTILSYDYLWNNVRVLGGAYGCMNSFTRAGFGFFVSYRDPNLRNTIDVYKNAAEYIKNLELDERQVLQFIIGTLADLDAPMTPSQQGSFGLRNYMNDISFEDIQKERDEVLGINKDIIKDLYRYIEAMVDEDCLCVVGNADTVKEAGELFDKIEQLVL